METDKFYEDLSTELAPVSRIEKASSDDPFVLETELKSAMEHDVTKIHNLKKGVLKPPEKPLSLVLPLLFILTILIWAWLSGRVF